MKCLPSESCMLSYSRQGERRINLTISRLTIGEVVMTDIPIRQCKMNKTKDAAKYIIYFVTTKEILNPTHGLPHAHQMSNH